MPSAQQMVGGREDHAESRHHQDVGEEVDGPQALHGPQPGKGDQDHQLRGDDRILYQTRK